MKIFIDTNNRENIKVEVDYDKTKPVENIVAEYSGALAIAQSQKIEDLIDELGVDEKTKKVYWNQLTCLINSYLTLYARYK